LLDVIKLIERYVETIEPEVIYTQHGGDLNVDHSIVYKATLTAARPFAGSTVRAIYAYEVPSSTEWSFQSFAPVFKPNVFVDISTTLDVKIEAMKCYEREHRPFPHPRSSEALRATAHRWGSVVGMKAAEAFELVRMMM
jgi:LmbE family N-acetylglucosaminyl deacetylase